MRLNAHIIFQPGVGRHLGHSFFTRPLFRNAHQLESEATKTAASPSASSSSKSKFKYCRGASGHSPWRMRTHWGLSSGVARRIVKLILLQINRDPKSLGTFRVFILNYSPLRLPSCLSSISTAVPRSSINLRLATISAAFFSSSTCSLMNHCNITCAG